MDAFTSCKAAIANCLSTERFSVAHLNGKEKTMGIHIHSCCEIYYSISGGEQFFINDRCYDIEPSDVFIINQFESHYLLHSSNCEHERIVISIHPSFFLKYSSTQTDLGFCFYYREETFSHRLRLDASSQDRLTKQVSNMTSINHYGADLIEDISMIDLLVMLNERFQLNDQVTSERSQLNETVGNIIDYINHNVTSSITVASIAEHFYLNNSYICRLFKAETGITINKYIVARRISIAKCLLVKGYNVSQVCEHCGFNDYTNFIKSFTRTVGISPKKYGMNYLSRQ